MHERTVYGCYTIFDNMTCDCSTRYSISNKIEKKQVAPTAFAKSRPTVRVGLRFRCGFYGTVSSIPYRKCWNHACATRCLAFSILFSTWYIRHGFSRVSQRRRALARRTVSLEDKPALIDAVGSSVRNTVLLPLIFRLGSQSWCCVTLLVLCPSCSLGVVQPANFRRTALHQDLF